MKTIRILALIALVASTVTFDVAQADHPQKSEQPTQTEGQANVEPSTETMDLVSVARGNSNFKTLVTAIEAAGLVEELQGKGPFTFFAPTDDAFAQLPEGTMEDLLEPANKAMLAGILANHVVPGIIMSSDVKTMKAANISGHDLNLLVKDGFVCVDDAKVVKADIVATNGVIHGIDRVIMPAAEAEHPASDKPKDHPAH